MNTKHIFIAATAVTAFALAACSGASSNTATTDTAGANTSSSTTSATDSSTAGGTTASTTTSTTTTGGSVESAQKAIEAALAANPGYTVYELDWDDNQQWDVSLVGSDKSDIDVYIDANGTIVATDRDDDADDDASDRLIDDDEAALLAEASVTLADALTASGVDFVDDVDLTRSSSSVLWKIDECNTS